MFFSQYFSFPCQYHFANAPYSFIHLPPTLYNVFLPVHQFPLYQITHAPYPSLSTRWSHQDKPAMPGNLTESNALLEIPEYWIEKYFHFLLLKFAYAAYELCIWRRQL